MKSPAVLLFAISFLLHLSGATVLAQNQMHLQGTFWMNARGEYLQVVSHTQVKDGQLLEMQSVTPDMLYDRVNIFITGPKAILTSFAKGKRRGEPIHGIFQGRTFAFGDVTWVRQDRAPILAERNAVKQLPLRDSVWRNGHGHVLVAYSHTKVADGQLLELKTRSPNLPYDKVHILIKGKQVVMTSFKNGNRIGPPLEGVFNGGAINFGNVSWVRE